jgi:hypothetical protein
LYIANLSTELDSTSLANVLAAIQTQVWQDFHPEWGRGDTLTVVKASLDAKKKALIDDQEAPIIYLGDKSQDQQGGGANVHGYHRTNHGKVAYGFVYLDVCKAANEHWSITLSHEVLELLANPKVDAHRKGPDPRPGKPPGATVDYRLEICDPTQSDTYKIGDVAVANFVSRRYYGENGPWAWTNQRKLPLEPFGVRPRGYTIYDHATGFNQIDGKRVTRGRLTARAMLATYRRPWQLEQTETAKGGDGHPAPKRRRAAARTRPS